MKSTAKNKANDARKEYETPAVIYEGEIRTRAGSPFGGAPTGIDPNVSPENIFGDNG